MNSEQSKPLPTAVCGAITMGIWPTNPNAIMLSSVVVQFVRGGGGATWLELGPYTTFPPPPPTSHSLTRLWENIVPCFSTNRQFSFNHAQLSIIFPFKKNIYINK